MSESTNSPSGEVVQAYERYLQAFLTDDIETINSLVSYPLAYVGEGVVTLIDEFPVRPSVLREKTGWSDTINMSYKVVGISDTKAHLILESGTRVRDDGAPIEDINAFYAWTKTKNGWKIYAISDVRILR